MTFHDIKTIKKTVLNNEFVQVDFTTAKNKGRAGGTTTTSIIYPKELANLIKEK